MASMTPEVLPWAAVITTAGPVVLVLVTLLVGFVARPLPLQRLGQINDVLDKTPADTSASRALGFVRDQIADEYRDGFVLPSQWSKAGWIFVISGLVIMSGSATAGLLGMAPSWDATGSTDYSGPFIIGMIYLVAGSVVLLLHVRRMAASETRQEAYVKAEVLRRIPLERARVAQESAETAGEIARARASLRRSRSRRRLWAGAVTAAVAGLPALMVVLVASRSDQSMRRR